jgi:hypothetical protein
MEEIKSEVRASDICKSVGGLDIVDVFQLEDGRMEVTWAPTDHAIHDELAYLATTVEMPISRTSLQAKAKNDLMHYLFSRDNLWYGIRCPKSVWILFMKSQDISEETITSFINAWTKSPIKKLIDKELVDAIRGTKTWMGLE